MKHYVFPLMITTGFALLLLVGCSIPLITPADPTATSMAPTPTSIPLTPIGPPVPAEDYQPLEGVDCYISAQLITWDSDGFMESSNIKLICEEKSVDLVDRRITNGWLVTKAFGKIRIKSASGFSMTILVTPEQNSKMKEAFKQ